MTAEAGPASPDRPLCRPGDTCWCQAHAPRFGVLIDADAYFRAAREAMILAEREIVILAWEFHTKTELVRPPKDAPAGAAAADDGWPTRLGDFLIALAEAKPDLEIRIALWDFAMIYAPERELVPIFRLPWKGHPRIHLQMDSAHPPAASQHQKIVVVDDKVAFSGGLDLTANRWDTRQHLAGDPRRVNPAGDPYGPFHDAMCVADGSAARALAEIARQRWAVASGEAYTAPTQGLAADPWPASVRPVLRDVRPSIARTYPAYRGFPEVREVERLFLESIQAAQHAIYVEQQYFTSAAIGEALERSLMLPNGPDIVIVLPYETSGWLEETTMGVGRVRLQRRLEAADKHGRLRVYQTVVPGAGLDAVKLHAKLMMVDDRLLRVGSANMSNRSLGLDSECDVALEAHGDDAGRIGAAIQWLRDDLLAEHLGTDAETVRQAIAERGGLIAGIESLRAPEGADARTLIPLTHEVPEWMERLVPDTRYLDPERPIAPDLLLERFLPARERVVDETDAEEAEAELADLDLNALDQSAGVEPGEVARLEPAGATMPPAAPARRPRLRALLRFAIVLTAVSAVALAWSLTPLKDLTNVDRALVLARSWAGDPLAPLYAVGVYVVASLLFVPVTVLVTVTGLVFGPLKGFATAVVASAVAAAVTYGVGAALGRDLVRRLSGPMINRISERLSRRGTFTVALLRMVPVAPFSLINVAAGAIRIRLGDFLAGTLIGMAPGMAALTVFGDRIEAMLRDPSPGRVALLLGALALVVGVAYGSDRWAARRRRRREQLARQRAAGAPGPRREAGRR
jgi:phosphatidylserine/phosphatidylglycerophosphate/cardiolipin synthase-like enzyme/uncharacterized membrane protein YdjX (TVP38/TMEM64 family)